MTTPHALLTLATRLFRDNQYEKVIATANRLIESDPGSRAGWAMRGISQLRTGQLERALHDLERAMVMDPKSIRVREALAEVLYKLGHLDEAIANLDQVLTQEPTVNRYGVQARLRRALDWPCGSMASDLKATRHAPNNLELRCRVAQTALNEGDPELAYQIMDEGPSSAPAKYELLFAQIAYQLGKHTEAQRVASRLTAEIHPFSVRLQAALLLFKTGPFDAAANAFQRLATDSEANESALAWHTRCQLFSGHPDASKTLTMLCAEHPDQADSHCLKGIAHALRDELDAAEQCFQDAIASAPDHGEAHLWFGELQRRAGKLNESLSATDTGIYHTPVYCLAGEINRLLTVHGSESAPLNWIKMPKSVYLTHLKRARPMVSDRTWEKVMKTSSKKWVATAGREILMGLHGNRTGWPTLKCSSEVGAERVHLAPDARQESRRHQLLLRTRPPDEVMLSFDRLVKQYPEPTVYCHRGEVALWLGHYASAEADFEQALALDITTRWAWIGLGASQILTQRPELGLATFKRSKQHAHPGRTMWVYSAEAYRALGKHSNAKEHIEEALRINPERTSAHVLAGLIHCQQGALESAVREWRFIEHQVPNLCRPVRLPDERVTLESLGAAFEQLLTRMRGNRASTVITWFHGEALHLRINEPESVTAQYGL